MPTYTSTVPKNVYGFLQVESTFDVYKQPNSASKLIDTVRWNTDEVVLNKGKIDPTELFAVLVPHKNYAFCYVLDEEDGWYKILYDKEHFKTGWTKASKPEDFWRLKDFYTYFGKKSSLYFLRDADKKLKTLKSAPSDDSQSLQGFSITRNIKLIVIKGNWALVSVVDLESKVPKTGYVKWRGADGSLFLFPKMN